STIPHRAANTHENNLLGTMGTRKTARYRRSPSCITVGHRGRANGKAPQPKTCDKTGTRPHLVTRRYCVVSSSSQSARNGSAFSLSVMIVMLLRDSARWDAVAHTLHSYRVASSSCK